LIVAPPFAEYARALQRDGWHVDYFMLDTADGFALQLDRLQHRLNAGYDLLVLANPGNPTGRLYDQTDMQRLVIEAAASNVLLVVDEAFMDFCPWASAIPLISRHHQLVILRSLTKFHAIPGLRLGYAVAAPALISRLTELREPWSINALAQAAGLAALATIDHHAATLALIDQERTVLAAAISRLSGFSVFPGAANYLLLRLPPTVHGRDLAATLEEQRILIRPCGSFPGLDDSFIRVAVRTANDNARLVAALATYDDR
jgi:threonine-phosphate decarboxylase